MGAKYVLWTLVSVLPSHSKRGLSCILASAPQMPTQYLECLIRLYHLGSLGPDPLSSGAHVLIQKPR